jgi:hypothetical protein
MSDSSLTLRAVRHEMFIAPTIPLNSSSFRSKSYVALKELWNLIEHHLL